MQIGLFDIVGPIMVGPSSSHTAGAARLGLAGRKLLGVEVQKARILLHGSFAATYWGHRTDLALLAGLLGLSMDDQRIPQAEKLAAAAGLSYQFLEADLGDVHPNTVRLELVGAGSRVSLVGSSVGGGRIELREIDGFAVKCDGTYYVLITSHHDEPGVIAEIARVLSSFQINIAFMEVSRRLRGQTALMVAQTDDPLNEAVVSGIWQVKGVQTVRFLPPF